MHIEPGIVSPIKVMAANAAAIGVVGWGLKEQIKEMLAREPWMPLKTAAAAVFFSLFMQSFHMAVGPSELHFVGAMAMYLTLGFIPTLLGFALGLALQGLAFEPADLVHLGVNSLSLMLPLIAVHATFGKQLFDRNLRQRLSFAKIVRLDAMYYAGVTTMVGFWLLISDVPTPFMAWLTFASSYIVLVAIEPVFTWVTVKGLKKLEDGWLVSRLFVVRDLELAK